MSKKIKEALRTRVSGNKIAWTETFVKSKKFAKWKTTLNGGTLACSENLPTKNHLKKKLAIFFVCNQTPPPSPPPSVPSGVCTAFPQINQKLLITNTCHWLESITVILGVLKIFTSRETITHFRTIIFSQSPMFQFSSAILDGLCFSFNPIISSCKSSSFA